MANRGIKGAWRWLAAVGLIGNLVAASPALAQDATWLASPTVTNPADGNFDFNNSANWTTAGGTTPAPAPGSNTNSNTGTATFGATNNANISFSAQTTTLSGFTFTTGAPAYAFTVDNNLVFNGTGIVNGGSATIINNNNGNTSFFNTSTAGSATITNTNNTNNTNPNGNTSFFNTSTAGSATITNNNNGNTSFFDTSTAGSATITNINTNTNPNPNGNTSFFNASTAGSATITNNNTNTIFNDTSMAGKATITNTNNGGASFLNTSTAGNATITNNNFSFAGFIDSSSAGSAIITNNSGSNTQFGQFGGTDTASAGNAVITNNSGSATVFFAKTTAGSANITNNGGTGFFLDASSAGSANITNNSGSSTQFGSFASFGGIDTASAGNAVITNNSGGSTQFFANTTAGSATITNNSGSFTQFGQTGGTDTSTAGNAIITNKSGGSTQFFASTTGGSANITNNSGGNTSFFDNSTGGNARFINNAGGTVDFSASTGPFGNNKLSAGSIEGAGQFFLGHDQLTVGSNNLSTNVSGVISDCGGGTACQAAGLLGLGSTLGSLVKTGTGTLTLSGVNTYTGSTTVNMGTLEVDGSIAASAMTAVNTSGTLMGTGTVGATRINSGGMLAPGNAANPTGTLNVKGSLVFQSAAVYLIGINGANAASTVATGSATLTGASVSVASGSSVFAGTKYTILTANGGLGGTTFFNSNVSFGVFTGTLSYDPTHAFLTFSGGGVPIATGLNDNQRNVSSSLVTVYNNSGGLPPAFFNLLTQSGAVLANGLTQISGEIAVSSQQTTFGAMGQFMGVMTDPFMNRGGGFNTAPGVSGSAEEEAQASAYAAKSNPNEAFAFMKEPLSKVYDPRWSVWAAGFGGSQSTSGNAIVGSNNTTSNIAGTAVGADYLLSPHTIAGFALAGGGTNFSVTNGGGTGRSDLFQIGAYVRHTSGPAYISAAFAYGWQDITHNRTVTVAGLDQLRAQFNANAFSGRLEGGYRFISPWIGGIGITPYAAAQFVTFDLPRYAEQAMIGLNTFVLNYGGHDATDPRSELGVRTDKSWVQGDGILTLRGRFAWAHDYDPNRAISATFQSLPGASFVVNGAAQASDSALTTASIEKKWKNGWSAAATFEGEFSNVTSSYAGKGVVRYQW